MEYHGNFGHNLGRIQKIALMSVIVICYEICRLATQTVAPNITGFQGIKRCVKYLASHPHKPIFYPSNSYDGSNVIRLTRSGNQVEYYTTHNCLELHQDTGHSRILNRRRSVSGILHTMFGVYVFWKVHIKPAIDFYSTDEEIVACTRLSRKLRLSGDKWKT